MNKRLSVALAAAAATLLLCSMSAQAAEQSLLGIRIYGTVKSVLKRYGNPTFVLTSGQTTADVSGSGGPAASTGGPAIPVMPLMPMGMGGNGIGPLPPLNPMANMRRERPPEIGMQAAPPVANPDVTVAQPDNGEVTLVYERPNGVTYQFLLSPGGHVIQITALGYADAQAKTSHGIGFGTSYTHVLAQYGYPQDQTQTGEVTVLNYSNTAHAAFQLVSNRVVGIIVAAID